MLILGNLLWPSWNPPQASALVGEVVWIVLFSGAAPLPSGSHHCWCCHVWILEDQYSRIWKSQKIIVFIFSFSTTCHLLKRGLLFLPMVVQFLFVIYRLQRQVRLIFTFIFILEFENNSSFLFFITCSLERQLFCKWYVWIFFNI